MPNTLKLTPTEDGRIKVRVVSPSERDQSAVVTFDELQEMIRSTQVGDEAELPLDPDDPTEGTVPDPGPSDYPDAPPDEAAAPDAPAEPATPDAAEGEDTPAEGEVDLSQPVEGEPQVDEPPVATQLPADQSDEEQAIVDANAPPVDQEPSQLPANNEAEPEPTP